MDSEKKILILFGSETGTAQEVAEGIWRDSVRFGFNGTVTAMDDYDISKLIFEPLIIFVCSTTGQGDPPNNMRKFWRFLLRKSLPSNSLINSHVAVLGLGDSSYAKFNFAAKKLYKRLLVLGAKSVIDVGLCDDQHDLGLDAVAGPWSANLWSSLESLYPHLTEAKARSDHKSLLLRWKCIPTQEPSEKIDFPPGEPLERLTCTVTGNQRVTADDHFQDVRLITLKPENGSVQYCPGAVAYVRPHNSPASVKLFLSLLQHQLENRFRLESVYLPLPEVLRGSVLSLEDVASIYWDLNLLAQERKEALAELREDALGEQRPEIARPVQEVAGTRGEERTEAVPRRRVFEILSQTTSSDLEKEKLEEFLSPGGLDDLYSYCNRPRRTTLEVLADFPGALSGLKLDHLFEIFQPIRPRAYSISSSIEYDGAVIQILVAVVKYKTLLSTPRLGLATNWLASLAGEVVVALKPPTLKFPEDSPIVMVGPGTGVAPFRSYISQTIAESFGKGDTQKPQMVLVFGSRYEKKDFHFREEFLKWNSTGDLVLITAFSRDQPDKIYVQHRIEAEGRRLYEVIHNHGGYIFVAGSSKDMPTAVKNSFIQVIAENSGMSNQEATAYIEKMESTGRYQEETWS